MAFLSLKIKGENSIRLWQMRKSGEIDKISNRAPHLQHVNTTIMASLLFTSSCQTVCAS